MSQNHYTSKPKRRPRSKNRRDWTRETMLALRSPEAKQAAFTRAMEIADWKMKLAHEHVDKKLAKARRWS